MKTKFFQSNKAVVGKKEINFVQRVIRDRFHMFVPADFVEDGSLVSNYTYLFSKDKSPLSIAIKFSPTTGPDDEERQIRHYFSQTIDTLDRNNCESGAILFRETVTSNQYFSIYSLRFSVQVEGGLLFGCFNCSADFREDWRPVVLEMLQNIEKI